MWRVLKHNDHDQLILLELKPVTGRTHQLRVHCAALGSGIVGDSLYGDNPIVLDLTSLIEEKEPPALHLRLHAYKLSFPHPITDKVDEFSSDIVDWVELTTKAIVE